MGTAFKAVEIQRAGKQWGNLPLTRPRHQQSQHVRSGTINFVERTNEMRSLGREFYIVIEFKTLNNLEKGKWIELVLAFEAGNAGKMEKWDGSSLLVWGRQQGPSGTRSGHKCGALLLLPGDEGAFLPPPAGGMSSQITVVKQTTGQGMGGRKLTFELCNIFSFQ